MARILGTWPDGSPEWLAARDGRVGGSDIATICGWSKWERRDQLLNRKAGLAEPRRSTAATQRGHLLEPVILAWLCHRHGLVIDSQASGCTYVADDNRCLANPDGITVDGVLLEAKSTSDRSDADGWGRAGTDLIPIAYQAQVQWYLGILGLDSARVGVLSGATNGRPDLAFATYSLRFNPAIYRHERRMAARFLHDLDLVRKATS